MDYKQLIAAIEKTFVEQDDYLFDKYVPEFSRSGTFIGDCFIQTIVEPRGDGPPRFYHNFSPFDVISKEAPEQALVFENGKLLFNTDFTNYVVLRTAAMSTVLLRALGITSLIAKRVLLCGGGRIATEAVKILAYQLGLTDIDVITRSADLTKIKNTTAKDTITINAGSLDRLSDYDVIICHTNSTAPIMDDEHIGKIKPGAVLCSFISSTDNGEFPDGAFDAAKANIVADWDKTIIGAKDMQRAQNNGLFQEDDMMVLKDLLKGKSIDTSKQYTIYRSTGTPIQNLAILKELIK